MKYLLFICIFALSAMTAFGQTGDAKKFANEAEVPRITVDEAKKAFDDGSAVFVDSRSHAAFEQERIKGAVQIEGAAEDRFDKLPKGKKIIVYCT
ncbi:MAG: rhodanese-like domain-containing protein [Pyrinomonadaceae bacterium]